MVIIRPNPFFFSEFRPNLNQIAMKKLILLPLLLSLAMPVSAQNWVTIPDANFVNRLNQQFPSCMNGNQMNTDCPGIVNATVLNVQLANIADLTGLEYFVNLEVLNCSNNNILSSLPELPTTLTELWCNGNNLTSLPELPPNLTKLICFFNQLTAIPELPSTLTELRCHSNNIITIPQLPSALTQLWCAQNNLNSLPVLPESLTQLRCGENELTALPELPISLVELQCQYNSITWLPELPPSLSMLLCHSNSLNCLPTLPLSLTNSSTSNFNISLNPLTCLPNYVPAMDGPTNSVWLTYPLCGLGELESNPNNCSTIDGIAGTVYNDINGDCLENEAEVGVVNATIKLLNEFDEIVATANSFGSGESALYNFAADPGNYTVQLVTENMPFQTSCANPGGSQEVELTTDEPIALNVNFGVECSPGFDVGVQSVLTTGWVFPGQIHTLKIASGDMSAWHGLQCAEDVEGTVTVYVDGPVSYAGPAGGALTPTVTGDLQFTYDIADFSLVNMHQDFRLLLETDTTAQEGDLICVDIVVDPIDGDFNPDNNTHSQCYEVFNSYDPNIKQVWPHDVAPGYDDYFNYTIYFQNTGTAPAFNIRLADTLDTNLDLNTFEVTAYSHPVLTYLHGNVLTFRFNNIMLPDSTTDFEGSIGYVQYRIKAVEGLPVGTVIENTAHIYFDFNEAIVTNTTQNEFVIITSANQPQQQLATVFPNPANGQFNVLFTNYYSGTTHMEVYNLSGQRVMQRQVNENQVVLDLVGYPAGMYFLHVRNERGSETLKLIKQ
ncbi:MAG: T9SS C-terminal target domain-containing protein [Cryomorphaceae bacterium]|nr:MAG: T9SS C-terminal target domain-containing protein [Cryomorphaceae bacterium]